MKQAYDLEEKLNKMAQVTQPDPKFSENLWEELQETPLPIKRKNLFSFVVGKPGWSIVSVLLAGFLIFSVVNPTRVYAAFQYLLRYLPGIGFVEDSEGARSIVEPVENSQDGVSIVIDQAVVDMNRTIISYELSADSSVISAFDSCFYDENVLKLSDGTILKPIGGGVQGHSARIEFLPIPDGVDSAELLVSRMREDETCSAPLSISTVISFSKNIDSTGYLPVYQAEEIQIESGNGAEAPSIPTEDEIAHQIRFLIDHLVELDDGYLLTGHAEWKSDKIENVIVNYDAVRLVDANGATIAIRPTEDGTKDSEFAMIIQHKEFSSPLTLNIEEVLIGYQPDEQNTFSFDTGCRLESGQNWDIGHTIDIDGQKIEISKVQYLEYLHDVTGEQVKAFVFDAIMADEIHSVNLGFIEKNTALGSYFGSNKPLEGNHMQITVGSENGFPTGELTFVIHDIMFNKAGMWSVDWQLPGASQ